MGALPEQVTREAIAQWLPASSRGVADIRVFETLASTNDKAKELAREGAPDGTIVVALSQSAGRGRMGRGFYSPKGEGLYMTGIYRPQATPARLMPLTAFAAVAVCDAVEHTAGFRPRAKWPNDIVVGDKKLCGILTESALDAARGAVRSVVVGVGVNVAQESFPEELAGIATSLRLAAGAAVPVPRLCAAIALRLADAACACTDARREAWMARYRQDCVTVGRRVALVREGAERRGTAVGIDDDAALTVRFDCGRTEAVSSGEVVQQTR